MKVGFREEILTRQILLNLAGKLTDLAQIITIIQITLKVTQQASLQVSM